MDGDSDPPDADRRDKPDPAEAPLVLPGGGGKVLLLPDYVQAVTEREIVLRNDAGETFRYVLPRPDAIHAFIREQIHANYVPTG